MKPDVLDINLRSVRGNVDFSLADGDFSALANKGFASTDTEFIQTVKDDILMRLVSIPGEWLGSPHMGSGIRALVGRPSTPALLGQITDRVYVSLTRDLKIPPNDLTVQVIPHSQTEVTIKITIIVDGDPVDMSPGYLFDFNAGLVQLNTGGV